MVEEARVPKPEVATVVVAIVFVTALVTSASYLAPYVGLADYSALAVAVCFLGATWWLVLRHDAQTIELHGLALGGVLLPEPIEPRRALRSGLRALVVASMMLVVVAIPFWFGYRAWFSRGAFSFARTVPNVDAVLGQLFVIALPEEAFYRGWLQTSLDARFAKEVRVFGLPLTWGIVITSAIFAVGHFLTIPNPARLAVFFPSLLFGALRRREGGIGAAFVFHAMCNLLSGAVAAGFSGAR
jgi:membrane protease YdiL (CAAX protease family)